MSDKQKLNLNLTTPFEDTEIVSTSWESEHPRPQLRRDSFISLVGEWQLSVVDSNGEESPLGNIRVPFPPESRISGIGRLLGKGEKYVYRKTFDHIKKSNGGRTILHFDAVDQIADVSVNGHAFPSHVGGYLPFEFDVTNHLVEGENTIEVTVTDEIDRDLGWGKQTQKRGGMWYTPTSGIWKSVWLENVPESYIKGLKITPTTQSVTVEVTGGEQNKILTYTDGDEVKKIAFVGNTVTLTPDNVRLWSPEDPYLYEFTLESGDDKIYSYFALRTVSIERVGDYSYIALNGKPYFCHGLLDQGYYSDGIYTPASPDGLIYDVKKMKELGFNMLRKHIKIEHELFYYYCDKYGMLVFQDMVNSGNYSFLVDTALPTIGLKRGITHKATPRRRENFREDTRQTISLLYNHPSVVYYTVFNEGWGQFDADKNYMFARSLDPTRIYDATSGWFHEKLSDVQSEHIYFRPLSMRSRPDRPLVLSEFGGYSCSVDGHVFNLEKSYGYSTCDGVEAFEEAFFKLYREQVIPQMDNGLCATVYTQVSDVEDEINGLVTYDRRVVKVNTEKMRALADELRAQFEQNLDKN